LDEGVAAGRGGSFHTPVGAQGPKDFQSEEPGTETFFFKFHQRAWGGKGRVGRKEDFKGEKGGITGEDFIERPLFRNN